MRVMISYYVDRPAFNTYPTQAFSPVHQISARPESGDPFDADSLGPWSELPLSASDGAH
jgi:hypothetical protein